MRPLRALTLLGLGLALHTGCTGPRLPAGRQAQALTPPVQVETARLSRLARAAYDKGSFDQAEALYRRALSRARAADAAGEIGDAAYNLAAVLMTRGRVADARPLLDEAETELARAGQPLADVWLLKARLAAREGDRTETLRRVQQVRSHDRSRPAPGHLAAAALLEGDLACDQGDAAAARTALRAARDAGASANLSVQAGEASLTGRIAVLEGQHADAAAAFDREADLWRKARQHQAMADALARAGEAFAATGQQRAAAERVYRAARSCVAQGDLDAGRRLSLRALTLAEQGSDTTLGSLAHALSREIEERSGRERRSMSP